VDHEVIKQQGADGSVPVMHQVRNNENSKVLPG